MPASKALMRLRYLVIDNRGQPKQGEASPTARAASTVAARERSQRSDQPSLIHFSSMPLFRLERDQHTYAHLLKKKDAVNIAPIVNYCIRQAGDTVYLGGEAVRNLYFHGRKRYKVLNILAILTAQEVESYAAVMNNIISSNDGAFSLGFKFSVRKNRCEGCFKEIALARYVIEPRLVGPEKLLYPFRPASVELDLTTPQRFAQAFGVEMA